MPWHWHSFSEPPVVTTNRLRSGVDAAVPAGVISAAGHRPLPDAELGFRARMSDSVSAVIPQAIYSDLYTAIIRPSDHSPASIQLQYFIHLHGVIFYVRLKYINCQNGASILH